MTQAQVKETLPDVRVIWNGREYCGRIYGRKERFATVCLWDKSFTSTPPEFSYAWQTIADALTNNRPLKA